MKMKGDKNPSKRPEVRAKISESLKGRNSHENYTYEELFGKEKTEFQKKQGCGYGHKPDCNCFICKRIKKYEPNAMFKDRNWLAEQYYGNELTLNDIATLENTTSGTIAWWMRKYKYEPLENPYERKSTKEKMRTASKGKTLEERGHDINNCMCAGCQTLRKEFTNSSKGKTYEEVYGLEQANIMKDNTSYTMKRLWKDKQYRKKLIKSHIDKEFYDKYGISKSDAFPAYGKYWEQQRKKALKRAGYVSELSGNNGGKLSVHHIYPYYKQLEKFVDLCLKPHIPELNGELLKIVPTLIPTSIIKEAHNLDFLIVLTFSEHSTIEGKPFSFFENIKNLEVKI